MNILFICNEFPPEPHGGIGTFCETLSTALVVRGHTVVVAGIYSLSSSDKEYILHPSAIPLYRVRRKRGSLGNLWSRLMLFLLLQRLIKRYKIQIVEFPDYEGMFGYLPRLGVPNVVRLHGTRTYFSAEMKQPISKVLYYFERSALRKSSHVVGVSAYAAQKPRLLFHLKSPVEIVYNSIPMPEEEGIRNACRISGKVVFTGTLNRKKGVLPLFESWPLVVNQISGAKLYIIGRDSMENGKSFKNMLMHKLPDRLAGTVIFLGHVERPLLLNELRTASVAVFPSFSETFGLAPIEAMACGCPTIFTKYSSGPEIITDNVDGKLIDPLMPHEIADAIVTLLKDHSLAMRLGSEGRKTVRARFSLEKIILQNEAMDPRVLS